MTEVDLSHAGLGYVELDEVWLPPDQFDALRLKPYQPILLAPPSDRDAPRTSSSSSPMKLIGCAVPSGSTSSAGEALVHPEVLRRWNLHNTRAEGHLRASLTPLRQEGRRAREVEVELLAADGSAASLERMMGTTESTFAGGLRRRMAGKWGAPGCTLLVSILGKTHALMVKRMDVGEDEGHDHQSTADSTLPSSSACCTRETRWKIAAARPAHRSLLTTSTQSHPLSDAERQIRTLLELEFRRKESMATTSSFVLGLGNAVLLNGVAGVGKWSAAQRIGASLDAEVVEINLLSGNDVLESVLLETSKRSESMPSKRKLIVLRQLEAFASPPADEDASSKWIGHGATSKDSQTNASRLLDLLDSASKLPGIAVLGLLRQGYSLPSSFLRPPHFSHSFTLPAPNAAARSLILRCLLDKHQVSSDDLQFLAEATQGYVARDLVRLCRRIIMYARIRAQRQGEGSMDNSSSPSVAAVQKRDMEAAMLVVRPSQLFELAVRPPRVKWEDVAGCEDARRELEEAIKWGLSTERSPLLASLPQQAGVLLFGPSGCGKTMCAHALASSTHLPFITVKGPELFSKYLGETESLIRKLFERARQVAPCIVFFDEIDALAPTRGGDTEGMGGMSQRVLSQLLNEMDGVSARSGVLLLACSSRPDLLDPALLRPGRLERLVYVGPPSAAARAQILEIKRRQSMPFADDVDGGKFAELTDGLTPAEILACCSEAALIALTDNRDASVVEWRHVQAAVNERRKSGNLMTQESLFRYHSFRQHKTMI